MSIDLEDWFHSLASFSPKTWDGCEFRCRKPVEQLLKMLSEGGAHATFFVLGDVAKRDPSLIREIAQEGHEIASHGMNHEPLYKLSRAAIAEDLRACKTRLEDLISRPVRGYRAPWWSITNRSLHALDIIKDEAFSYDASIFPARYNGFYGIRHAPLWPYWIALKDGRRLLELPPAVSTAAGFRVPVGGGIYWRLLPRPFVLYHLRKLARNMMPAVLYVHPWELDRDQPRPRLPLVDRWIHYVNLGSTQLVLSEVLKEFKLLSIEEAYLNDPPPSLTSVSIEALQ